MQKVSHSGRLQSAMEYLMTYGWSILVIAIVVAALYTLGIFGGTNFSPKAPPGNCHIARPYGAGTTTDINLEGTCNGELPEYVAHADGTNPPSIVTQTALPVLSQVTVVGWIYRAVNQINGGGGIASDDGCFMYFGGGVVTGSNFATWGCNPVPGPYYSLVSIPANQWVMVAYTVDSSGNVKSYDFEGLTTVLTTSSSGNVFTLPSATWVIGGLPNTPGQMNGSIADVQVYNTAMSQNDLQTIYTEGIGGVPTELQYLVAWWPLNGDVKDYGGNGYNARATGNVIFTNSWINTYTAP